MSLSRCWCILLCRAVFRTNDVRHLKRSPSESFLIFFYALLAEHTVVVIDFSFLFSAYKSASIMRRRVAFLTY